jgi:O-antigen/teichoic acid export membrane protein
MSRIAINALSWNLISKIFANGGQLAIYFVLARLLTPSDFGTIAIVLVFINVSNIFAIAGLGAAIIQNHTYDKEKFDTIYFTSLIFSLFVILILFFLAPVISNFYNSNSNIDLKSLIRISLPIIVLNSINSIQSSILQRDLNFKKMFLSTSIPLLISGFISIILAYYGFGIYSLIANNLISSFVSIVFCFLFYLPLPSFTFNIKHAINSLNYSYKILVTALFDEINKSFFTLLIGKKFSNETLGNYNMGRQLPTFASATLNSTIASVFFPFYAQRISANIRNDIIYRKVIRVLNFIIFPFIGIVFIIADEFIMFFFTDKWVHSIFYFKIFALILGLHHLHTKVTYFINAVGDSHVTLKYELTKKIIGIFILIITLPFGINSLLFGQVVVALISILIMFFPTKKYLGIEYKDQMLDILPLFISNCLLCLLIIHIKSYFSLSIATILIYPLLYLILYIVFSYLFSVKAFKDIILLRFELINTKSS